jgi:hypothetical protein
MAFPARFSKKPKRTLTMKPLAKVSQMLALGFAASVGLLAADHVSAQCPNGYYLYYPNGYYSGGSYFPGYTYYPSAPVYDRAAPSAKPPKVEVGQSTSQTYQSFSATPQAAPPAATSPAYSYPSYPMQGSYYSSPYTYGSYGSSSNWRDLNDARHHGIP